MRAEEICHKCLIQLMVFISVMTLPLITHHLLKTSVNEAFPDCTGFRFLVYCISLAVMIVSLNNVECQLWKAGFLCIYREIGTAV